MSAPDLIKRPRRRDDALRFSPLSAMEAWQIAARGRKNYQTPEGIRVSPAVPWLATLM